MSVDLMLSVSVAVADVSGTVIGIVAVGSAAGAAMRWLFAPRFRAWVSGLLRPVSADIASLREENTAQHLEGRERLEGIRAEASERWDRHERDHDGLERALGKLEGWRDGHGVGGRG